jgi:hypothetical protein
VIVLLGPETARAACSPDVLVTSDAEVCVAGNCTNDFRIGHPARSQRSYGVQFTNPRYDVAAASVFAIDNGGFDVSTEISGTQEILAIPLVGTPGGTADATGQNLDCFTFGGLQGTGIAHLPIRPTGSVSIGWSFAGPTSCPGAGTPRWSSSR